MADIKVNQDSKLIKVLAAQARNERVDSGDVEQASNIIKELAQDMNPQNRHEIAQTIAYTVNELQQKELDFLNKVADIKNVGAGEKAAFNVKQGTIKAYIQAKGATTARSMVGGKQLLVDTKEISARPAINIVDLRTGRVNMADLIREANNEITNKKVGMIQSVLQAAIANYSSPFYGTATGFAPATFDPMLQYFSRLGPVTILGDQAAVGELAPFTGMAMSSTLNQFSNEQINEFNGNGFIGRYKGADVVSMNNIYQTNTTTPVLDVDWIYIIPGGMTGDARNLKVVNEGSVNAFDSQNIDDMVYEVRLDQWFGAAFCAGKYPTIGAYVIG